MNMIARTKKAAVPTDDWAALSARVPVLNAQVEEFLQEVIQEEARGLPDMGDQSPAAEQVEELATRILDGADVAMPAKTKRGRLFAVRLAHSALKRARALLEERMALTAMRRAQDERLKRAMEWRELIHDTAITACRLQALSRRRLALAAEIRGNASSHFVLPCEFQLNPGILLGMGGGGPAHEFLRYALLEGFITVGEIAKARGDSEKDTKNALGL